MSHCLSGLSQPSGGVCKCSPYCNANLYQTHMQVYELHSPTFLSAMMTVVMAHHLSYIRNFLCAATLARWENL